MYLVTSFTKSKLEETLLKEKIDLLKVTILFFLKLTKYE